MCHKVDSLLFGISLLDVALAEYNSNVSFATALCILSAITFRILHEGWQAMPQNHYNTHRPL